MDKIEDKGIIVEKVLGKSEDFDFSSLVAVDKVFFDHESLRKGHQRINTESGREIMISLEHGEALFCGAVLYRDDEVVVIADMPEEDVIEFMPRDNIEWSRVAYNIGNMHNPAYLYEDCILTIYDESLKRLAEALDIPWRRCMRKLDGLRAGESIRGMKHSHE